MREPFETRRDLLKSSFNHVDGVSALHTHTQMQCVLYLASFIIYFCHQEFMFAEYMDTDDVDQIQEFMDKSIKGAHE